MRVLPAPEGIAGMLDRGVRRAVGVGSLTRWGGSGGKVAVCFFFFKVFIFLIFFKR